MKWLSRLARRFTSARALCVVLLFALLFLRVTDPAPLEELRLRAFDIFQVIKPRVATQRPVVIVDIDEESLRKLGQWPWPRTRVADLVTRLTELGAAAIAFDMVFAEPDRLSPALAADGYPRSRRGDAQQAARAAEQRPGDGRRHQAVARRARRDRPAGRRAAAGRPAAGGRRCRAGRRSEAVPVSISRACLRNVPVLEQGRRRARAVHHPLRARRHRAPRADGDAGAGQRSCRR